ncbi:mucin-2 isoform X2 [Uranotaenia lowii]|uniref:mucin-2 isoform X2 n=1 Tax=Uranotaenia lowii TaxID=190385 RepID=UPI00247A96FB|nr:mucin-2 isoform X2 [Uranotaenia lowii]
MNRAMRSYTPGVSKPASRKSTIGMESPIPSTVVPGSQSASQPNRRRYSVSFGTSVSAAITVSSGDGTQTPRGVPKGTGTGGAAPLGRSFSQGTPEPSRRKSLHENLILKILSTPVDQPLSLNDSISSDASFCSSLGGMTLSDQQLMESDDILRCTTPPTGLDHQNNPRLARLYRDLQSPSATTRMRALRALRSPTKRDAYGQFDVPYEQQDIITEEERQSPQQKTIQDIMANVVVYVEVRSGADNRSDGIKDHVAALGAQVNEKLYKNTTHVIFKDGLLSTYQKAKKMNIPIVSILWIEGCKRHMCLMKPESYPISNLERYENPELFKKIRRQKSMQPRAEEANSNSASKKRPPISSANASNSNSKTTNITSKLVASPPAKLPVLHRIRNDDGLERIISEFVAENQNTPEPQDDFDRLLAGPSKLMEIFRNSPSLAGVDQTPSNAPEPPKELAETPKQSIGTIRKSLFNNSSVEKSVESETRQSRRRSITVNREITPTASARQRRKTTLFTPRITSVEEESSTAMGPPQSEDKQKSTRNRRKTMNISSKENSPPKSHTIYSPKAMEMSKASNGTMQSNASVGRKKRETIYSPKKMEQSTNKTDTAARITRIDTASARKTLAATTIDNISCDQNASSAKKKTPEVDAKQLEAFRTNRRRTLYTPGVYEEMADKTVGDFSRKTPALNRRSTIFNPPANSTGNESLQKQRSLYTPTSVPPSMVEVPETPETPQINKRHTIFAVPNPEKTPSATIRATATPGSAVNQIRNKTLLEEYETNLTFSSTKTPVSQRRKTIFDISMDIIEQRLSQINKQSQTANPSTNDTPALDRIQSAELALKSPPPKPVEPTIARQTSLDTFYRKMSKSSEKLIKFKTSLDLRQSSSSADSSGNVTTIPRKRKLFNAQPSIEEPLTPKSQNSNPSPPEDNPQIKRTKTPGAATTTTVITTTPASTNNKRRSVAVTSLTKSSSVVPLTSASRVARRSTMFFESATTTHPRPLMGTQARSAKAALQLGGRIGAGLPSVVASQTQQRLPSTPLNTVGPFRLATTNLHAPQQLFVKEI